MENLQQQGINLFLGQELARAGFKSITDTEITKMLGCKEIEHLENEKIKSDFYQKVVEDLKNKFKNRKASRLIKALKVVEEHRVREYDDYFEYRFYTEYVFPSDPYSNRVKKALCTVKYTKLENYVDSIIPEDIVNKIEMATLFGITNFYVCTPQLVDRKLSDPIVIGILGGEELPTKIFIGQYD